MKFAKEYETYMKFEEELGAGYEDEVNIENIGWSLGNECPYKCKHCYSAIVREKGRNLDKNMIDIIISQMRKLPIKTVNLGGNEPWFTSGISGESLLPYILKRLSQEGYKVGITTAGITLVNIERYSPESLKYINDVDISLDHADPEIHNKNRGANIYDVAINALEIANRYNIEHSIIMCAMNWNFNIDNLDKLKRICKKYNANLRFNVLKPIEKGHMDLCVSKEQFYEGYEYILNNYDTIDITEPRLSALVNNKKDVACPCGTTSMRIHSITNDGEIYVSPCIYMHDFKVGDLLKDDILDVVHSEPFRQMRLRNYLYRNINECHDCEKSEFCGGGCAAQAYLINYWKTGKRTLSIKEEDCWRDLKEKVDLKNYIKEQSDKNLVHINYLCTWIGKPRK